MSFLYILGITPPYLKDILQNVVPTVVVIQSLSYARLLETSWTAARQASLSFTVSQILLKLTSIESVMSSNHLVLIVPFSSCLQSLPASGSFLMSQLFTSHGKSIGASASASVLPMNSQCWFPLGLTGLISLQSRGLSRVFSGSGFIYSSSLKLSFFTDEMGLTSNL